MGRIDLPGDLPEPRRGPGGNVFVGIAAVAIIAFGAYELGRRNAAAPTPIPRSRVSPTLARARSPRAGAEPAPVPRSTEPAVAAIEHAPAPPKEERSQMEVTIARTAPPQATATTTPSPETARDKMARCLSFRVENDEIHYGGYSPLITPLKVTGSNSCSFSFEGPDVSVEVRAVPMHGEGTMVRAVGQFRDPIPSRGQAETQIVIACPRCDEVTHRFEVRLQP